MGPTVCPETSVRNYHFSLRNNPEGWSSHNQTTKVSLNGTTNVAVHHWTVLSDFLKPTLLAAHISKYFLMVWPNILLWISCVYIPNQSLRIQFYYLQGMYFIYQIFCFCIKIDQLLLFSFRPINFLVYVTSRKPETILQNYFFESGLFNIVTVSSDSNPEHVDYEI
jgi:hypothetical protein